MVTSLASGAMKHVGILAHSFEGAMLCYRTICLEGAQLFGAHNHPEITLTGVPMHRMMAAWAKGDHRQIRAQFAADVAKLQLAGADFFVCPDNTAHIALESDGEPLTLPFLNIADVVAQQAQLEGRKKVAILGTEWTMTGPVYPRAFGEREISLVIPDEQDRRTIDRVIFNELCVGIVSKSARIAFVEIIQKLADRGCDAVALVCTEIPLLITQAASPLPVLDSTRLLARAALYAAAGDLAGVKKRGSSLLLRQRNRWKADAASLVLAPARQQDEDEADEARIAPRAIHGR